MYYKIDKPLFTTIVNFMIEKQRSFTTQEVADFITSIAYEDKSEDGKVFIAEKDLNEILRSDGVPIINAMKNSIILRLWDCEKVEEKDRTGDWIITLPRTGDVFTLPAKEYLAIKDLYNGGRRIQCIKLIREFTGMGLKDALEVYDQSFINATEIKK